MNPSAPAPYPAVDPTLLVSLIQEKYGLNDIKCELLLRGVGDTYKVDSAQGRFILRIYRPTHRDLAQIQAEVKLLVELKQAGVLVSHPIADLAGEYIQQIDTITGIRHAVLFSYAPGNPVSILNENQLRSLGHEMARFHNVSANIDLGNSPWNYDQETTLYKPLEILKPYFTEDPAGYAWLQKAVKQAAEKLDALYTPTFSIGYCQFDFLPKNFHFEGDSITLFDFDFLGYGWLVNDVMTFWQHLCLDVHFGKMTQGEADEAYDILLRAYQEIRPLSKQELAAVPYLSLGFWLFYSAFHTTHNLFYPYVGPLPLKRRFTMVRQLMERY